MFSFDIAGVIVLAIKVVFILPQQKLKESLFCFHLNIIPNHKSMFVAG